MKVRKTRDIKEKTIYRLRRLIILRADALARGSSTKNWAMPKPVKIVPARSRNGIDGVQWSRCYALKVNIQVRQNLMSVKRKGENKLLTPFLQKPPHFMGCK